MTITHEYRLLAAFSYLFWPFSLLLVLTMYKKDRFLRFHGYQALFLGICGTVFYLVGGGLLYIIPFFGVLINKALLIVWFIFTLLLAFRCFQGEKFKIPVIYDLAYGVME
ncbi:MAG TPA: DUF4870 domain-containing protein [Bacillota bacterium]|jgi:uncharacterized membrane protein|nr:DUF4870 domain-containing protein [Bacillota bacterium]HOL09130.1 DUF4870 domain-containing protein [Bacillota bacterium]HPO97187.1 DUF4870 domain-containing protein [Bacillota bacterium]